MQFFYFENVVGYLSVVDVAAVDFLYETDYSYGDREYYDFVCGFEAGLCDDEDNQLVEGYDSGEGDGKEEEGVGAFAHHGRGDGSQRKVLAVARNFHFAHDIGVEEGAYEESDEAGQQDARGRGEYGFKGGLPVPKRCRRQNDGQLNEDDGHEVHQEPEPNDKSGFAVSPHFGDTIVDDVGDGKDDETCGRGDAS